MGVLGIYKPNSVPILPTGGGAKSSTLSLSKGHPSTSLGMLNFVFTFGEQNWQ